MRTLFSVFLISISISFFFACSKSGELYLSEIQKKSLYSLSGDCAGGSCEAQSTVGHGECKACCPAGFYPQCRNRFFVAVCKCIEINGTGALRKQYSGTIKMDRKQEELVNELLNVFADMTSDAGRKAFLHYKDYVKFAYLNNLQEANESADKFIFELSLLSEEDNSLLARELGKRGYDWVEVKNSLFESDKEEILD
jgi:hypothetical protein